IDAQAALTDANRAHQRRYLTISEPLDGIVRIDGLLDAEAGALVRNAVNAGLPPAKDDDRTPGQRRADRLVELCQPRLVGSADGPTTMSNLILLCRPHHRRVHEEGWGLQRLTTGRWALIRPLPRSRSA